MTWTTTAMALLMRPFPTLGTDCDGPDADNCANGTVVCTADKQGVECSNDVQQSEIQDLKDNDCDGLTDEDFPVLVKHVTAPTRISVPRER